MQISLTTHMYLFSLFWRLRLISGKDFLALQIQSEIINASYFLPVGHSCPSLFTVQKYSYIHWQRHSVPAVWGSTDFSPGNSRFLSWGGSSVLYHRQQQSTHLAPRATQNVVTVYQHQLHRICSRICTKLLCSMAQKHPTSWHFQVPLEATAGSLTESAELQQDKRKRPPVTDHRPAALHVQRGLCGTPAETPGAALAQGLHIPQGAPGKPHAGPTMGINFSLGILCIAVWDSVSSGTISPSLFKLRNMSYSRNDYISGNCLLHQHFKYIIWESPLNYYFFIFHLFLGNVFYLFFLFFFFINNKPNTFTIHQQQIFPTAGTQLQTKPQMSVKGKKLPHTPTYIN